MLSTQNCSTLEKHSNRHFSLQSGKANIVSQEPVLRCLLHAVARDFRSHIPCIDSFLLHLISIKLSSRRQILIIRLQNPSRWHQTLEHSSILINQGILLSSCSPSQNQLLNQQYQKSTSRPLAYPSTQMPTL